MVSVDFLMLNFASFRESLKTKEVLSVEITFLEFLHMHIVLVELLEVLGLFRVDHGILAEHNEHDVVECGEPFLCSSFLFVGATLVVSGW